MANVIALLTLAVVYYIGEFVGTKTKAWVPSVFVTAVLFLIGYWTIFPADIVDQAGLGAPFGGTIVIMLCLTHMGTIISIRQLLKQWKVVLIALLGLVGMIILVWFIVRPFVGREYVVAGLPPLTGGIVAAIMMNEAALELGLTTAATLAIAMYSIQGFVGYPLTAVFLKMEGRTLLKEYRSGELSEAAGSADIFSTSEAETKKLIPKLPDKYITTALILAKMMISALIAQKLASVIPINAAIWALLVAIVLTEIGFLDKDSLNVANSYGFLMFVLMIFIFAGLKDTTPEILAAAIGPMAIIIVVGVIGLCLASAIAGKVLGMRWNMACAVSLTALYGFPPNYVLTMESIKALTDDEAERQYLIDRMIPQMIVGGFTTVTIASVFIASIFVGLF
ncbi:MAG: hypothetical protein Q4P29_07485 [Tissierellia bacterium]|nr:hypothetical protein [Tissierellia bacterium]